MKTLRIFSIIFGLTLSMDMMAQKPLTEDGIKAQRALIEYLRSIQMSPSIDTKDNSVNFRINGSGPLYWVTFDESSPVLYTIHRNGVKFDNDPKFKLSCARVACNEVNQKHQVKCYYDNRRIRFVLETYAKNPSDFHGGFRKMLAAFKDVDTTFKTTYDKAYDKWAKDSIANNKPITPNQPVGESPLDVTYIAFGNFDAKGNVISDYNQPLRKSAMKYIKASVDVTSVEKGIFKIGMKIFTPDGKPMVATQGVDYSSTANIEIKKANKKQECDFDSYGSDTENFWQAGEYKVEIYDFEKGVKLFSTTFNIL